jgi:sulfite exporter TauE/SafE
MIVALVLAGVALGLASTPHCALMCATPCAAITGGRPGGAAGFQLGRLASYMAGGAVAAASVQALGTWARRLPALQPVWVLLHLGFLLLGAWWLATGRMPPGLRGAGLPRVRLVPRRGHALRAGALGLAWIALPCAASQGALLLAALADGPLGGALVMAGFALGSAPALAAAPWLWTRLRGPGTAPGAVARWPLLGYRLAGTALVATSAWAIAHDLREQVAALCAT